jgi:DNA-binding transcriptional MerR regulator
MTTSRVVAAEYAEQNLLPIREVSRLTGVNPVTLRAWERRYGLIQPQRTLKGHRLYGEQQVMRIHEILNWLERGVAVSQVRRLLQDPQTPLPPDNSLWTEEKRSWLKWIEQLAEQQLDDSFNRTLALYPPETLCQHLLLPLLEELRQRWNVLATARVEQVFFLSWLRSKLGARLYHSNCQHSGSPLLLLSLSDQAMQPELWLCAWLASELGYPVRVLDWSIPARDIAMTIRLIAPLATLFYSDQRIAANDLQHLSDASACPQLLCGQAVYIHHDTLSERPHLHLADSPLSALRCLQRLILISGN